MSQDSSNVFAPELTGEHNQCHIENALNEALREVMSEAEALLLERFGEITLDRLAASFKRWSRMNGQGV
ncbi:MAG: hypothetical protein ACX931_10250 [Saccharospirillum sp.]